MEISELFESDEEHFAALSRTGFFGKRGAGCIIFAEDTKRFLLAHRSEAVEQSGTWGTFGGAIDAKENPQEAAKREVHEEAGYAGPLRLVPLFVFKPNTFRYFNFLAIVQTEFTPRLNWESQGFEWCEFGKWPSPLHFGVKSVLSDPVSVRTMTELSRPE